MSEKIEILNKTPWFIYGFHNFILFTFSSAMEWSEDQNLALVREVLITEPYRFRNGCGFTSRNLQIGTISFIMLCNILMLKCENIERLSRNF